MEMQPLIIKIPENRVAVLIGTGGATKKRIEKEFKCSINISREGDVEIAAKDIGRALRAREAISAIARGFSPEHAMLLKNDEIALEIISLPDYGISEKSLERHKARLIGTRGKVRANIEEITDTNISIYGKTVAIIGSPENVKNARNAIELLLSGKTHRTSYGFLGRHAAKEDS